MDAQEIRLACLLEALKRAEPRMVGAMRSTAYGYSPSGAMSAVLAEAASMAAFVIGTEARPTKKPARKRT